MQTTPEHSNIYYPPRYQPVIGVVQIVHGMSEYQDRYRAFSEFLAANGYAVLTSDLKGHGRNVKRDAELGYFGDTGASGLISDVHEKTRFIRSTFPDVPYFMIGHGMGALICMAYLKKYDYFTDGVLLSGIPQNTGYLLPKLSCRVRISLNGEYHRSNSLHRAVIGSYENAFAFEGRYAWLSSDPDVCSAYEKDPRCGFIYTMNGFRAYFDLIDMAYKKGTWIRKNLHLPVRAVAGAKDPVSGTKFKLNKVTSVFMNQGYDDLDIQLIHGQRHDIYNDIGHERTYEYVLDFFDSILKKIEDEEETINTRKRE